MKFGKTLQKVCEEDKQYGTLYCQYKLLRKFLKSQPSDPKTQVVFMNMLEREHGRVSQIVKLKLAELEISCESLLTSVKALTLSHLTGEELESKIDILTHHADDVAERLAALDKFVFYNKEAFRKIVKKHDKITSVSLAWIEAQKRSVFVDAQTSLENVLVELSDIYKFIKQHSSKGAEEGQHKVSDDTFERKSHKYWVSLQDVFQFKVKVIKHLPLYFFARKKKEISRDSQVQDLLLENAQKENENLELQGWITSIYLDNDELGCYDNRMKLAEGATLFRVRWYGNPNDLHTTDGMVLPRAPAKGLYFERKTHHESWVQIPSIKERFPIHFDQVEPFMKGKLSSQEFLTGEKQVDLAEGFQEEIVRRELHPVIRTAYKRTAFQLDDTNDVRITLDTQLLFVNEHPRFLKPGAWKRLEEDIENDLDCDLFPYGVLEVKLKGDAPDWLNDILQLPYIRKVSKFSKFQQAVSSFYPHDVPQFPYWYEDDDIVNVKAKFDQKEKQAVVKMAAAAASSVSDNDVVLRVEDVPDTPVQGHVNAAFSSDEVRINMENEEKKVFRDPSFANGDKSPGNRTRENSGSAAGISRVFSWKKNSPKGKKAKPARVATERIKVEPKTHFANERTFLQWLRIGMTLFSLGGVIFNLSTEKAAFISGLVFMCTSSLILAYGLGMYYWRIWMINTRKRTVFHDKFGPAVLVILVLAALVVNLVLIFVYDTGPALPYSNSKSAGIEYLNGV